MKFVFQRQAPSVSSTGLPPGSSASLSNPDVVASVEEIWMQKAFEGGWAIKAGQFKPPFLREELVSFTNQLTLERSLINDTFTTKWTQGVQLEWQNDMFRVQGFYGDGLRANHVNPVTNAGTAGNYPGGYLTSFNVNETNYAFVGRAEWKAAGEWNQFKDFNSYRGDKFGALSVSRRWAKSSSDAHVVALGEEHVGTRWRRHAGLRRMESLSLRRGAPA
jgi:hypothetical protein